MSDLPEQPTTVAVKRLVGPLTRPVNLSDRVVAELETLIVGSRLTPGQTLPSERELAGQFNVSRTVVREAIRGLAARGLVDVANGRGTVVRAMSAESAAESMKLLMRMQPGGTDLNKVVEVRRVIEDEIARLSATRRTTSDLETMVGFLSEAEAHLDDPDSFVRADVGFHMALARATQNELFSLILDSLSLVLVEVRLVALRVPGTPERALGHHRAIFAAVQAKDAVQARSAMDSHMDEALDTLVSGGFNGDPIGRLRRH